MTLNKYFFSSFLLTFSLIASHSTAVSLFKQHAPKTYTVKKDDTVWQIAEHFLTDISTWKEAWHYDEHNNPDLIYPGDVITQVEINNEPKLTILRNQRPSASTTHSNQRPSTSTTHSNQQPSASTTHSNQQPSASTAYSNTTPSVIKKSPEIARVASNNAILPIPKKALKVFLNPGQLLPTKESFKGKPKIIDFYNNKTTGVPGDKFYISGELPEGTKNNYRIYRQGSPIIDPDTKKNLGIIAYSIGDAYLTHRGYISALKISHIKQPPRIGDYILPNKEYRLPATFFPKRIDHSLNGKIIHLMKNSSLAFVYDEIIINLGTKHDLEIGNLLKIYKPNPPRRIKLPGKILNKRYPMPPGDPIGYLLLYRVYYKASAGIILSPNDRIRIGDYINP